MAKKRMPAKKSRPRPRLAYRTPNGEWGLEGVDINKLSMRHFWAIHKLCHLEDLIEEAWNSQLPDYHRALAISQWVAFVGLESFCVKGEIYVRGTLEGDTKP